MKINVNTDRMREYVQQINGRASAHTLSAYDIRAAAKRCEDRLTASGVPLSMRPGTQAVIIPEGPGKAYARKGRYVVTSRAVLERGSRDWFLVEFEKIERWADAGGVDMLYISKEARDAITAKALADYDLRADTVDA